MEQNYLGSLNWRGNCWFREILRDTSCRVPPMRGWVTYIVQLRNTMSYTIYKLKLKTYKHMTSFNHRYPATSLDIILFLLTDFHKYQNKKKTLSLSQQLPCLIMCWSHNHLYERSIVCENISLIVWGKCAHIIHVQKTCSSTILLNHILIRKKFMRT